MNDKNHMNIWFLLFDATFWLCVPFASSFNQQQFLLNILVYAVHYNKNNKNYWFSGKYEKCRWFYVKRKKPFVECQAPIFWFDSDFWFWFSLGTKQCWITKKKKNTFVRRNEFEEKERGIFEKKVLCDTNRIKLKIGAIILKNRSPITQLD